MESEYADEPEDDPAPDDEYAEAAKEAFPNEDWTPERVDALKTLVSLCMSGGSDDKAGGDKGHTLMEIMFGSKPRKD